MGHSGKSVGAAEGIAIASLLSLLSTKTSVHTTIRFEAEDAEVFFFTDQALPREFEMRFANVPRAHQESTCRGADDDPG